MKELTDFFQTSPLLSGGLLVMVFGVIFNYLRSAPRLLWNLILRNFTNKISFTEFDPTYIWIESWFHENYKVNYGQYFLKTNYDYQGASGFKLTPSYTWYFKKYKNSIILIIKEKENDSNQRSSGFKEKIDIYVFGNREYTLSLIQDIKNSFERQNTGVSIYSAGLHQNWTLVCQKKYANKPILKEYNHLLEDLKNFYNSEKFYKQKGVNWKRGYFFYGIPGTGKTTTILSLASEEDLKKNVHMLSLGGGLTESTLLTLVSQIKPNSFLVIEDVDCFKVSNKRPDNPVGDSAVKEAPLSLSTLLNVLDGIYTPHGLVFFITSNKKETLDEALIRPGRIDVQVEFTNATLNQVESLYNRLSNKKHLFQDFSIKNPEIKTMAQAQELILQDNLL